MERRGYDNITATVLVHKSNTNSDSNTYCSSEDEPAEIDTYAKSEIILRKFANKHLNIT